jgi:hypothetical protein
MRLPLRFCCGIWNSFRIPVCEIIRDQVWLPYVAEVDPFPVPALPIHHAPLPCLGDVTGNLV